MKSRRGQKNMDALEDLLDEFDAAAVMPVAAPVAVVPNVPAAVVPNAPADLAEQRRIDSVYDLLYPYQVPHVRHMVNVLGRRSSAINGSDTGTGKMYTDSAVAAIMRRRMLVCCPKSVVVAWFEVAARFDVDLLGVANYEALRSGKYYPTLESFLREQREDCPYYLGNRADANLVGQAHPARWNLPNDALVVYDEAHKCRRNTATADLMTSTMSAVGPGDAPRVILSSATIADSVATFRNAAYMLGLAQLGKHAFAAWLRRLGANVGDRHANRDNPAATTALFHREMYPRCGSRMRIEEIRRRDELVADGVGVRRPYFANNDVASIIRRMSPDEERGIMDAYEEIAAAIEALKHKQRGEMHPLTVILRARQRIEMLKTPTIAQLAREWMLEGKHVVVFVNFDATCDSVFSILDKFTQDVWPGSCVAVIRGGQRPVERQWNIDAFQGGRARVIICNIRAGGVGISLHGANRASIISPPWSAIDYKQAEGRIFRAGGGDVIQRSLYCSGNASPAGPDGATNDTMFLEEGQRIGVEEKMARSLNKKLGAIHDINGDQPHRQI